MDHAKLRGEASRRLRTTGQCHGSRMCQVLEAFHGDDGFKAGARGDRFECLIQFTAAGDEIAEDQAKKDNGAKLVRSKRERIETVLQLRRVRKQAHTEQLVMRGLRQAEQLYTQAREAFASTGRR
jgi:hypothetical protein